MPELIDVCTLTDLRPGAMRLVETREVDVLVANCEDTLLAIENRCSHDDGPLAEGILDPEACTVECPRHGSVFDLHTGRPLTLPAYLPIETFAVTVTDGIVQIDME